MALLVEYLNLGNALLAWRIKLYHRHGTAAHNATTQRHAQVECDYYTYVLHNYDQLS